MFNYTSPLGRKWFKDANRILVNEHPATFSRFELLDPSDNDGRIILVVDGETRYVCESFTQALRLASDADK